MINIQSRVVVTTAVEAYSPSRLYCSAIILEVVIAGAAQISIRIILSISERKFSETISHPAQELQPFANVLDQADYRAGVIARCLEQAVLSGQVDAIVLTGGVIYSQAFRQLLLSRISYLGRVICKPGEEEMDSLAYYLNAVLTGELQPKEYN